tara:strand:- start:10 stop:435 length:426 start_codon:yes stop_codon:yes gene_type:complete
MSDSIKKWHEMQEEEAEKLKKVLKKDKLEKHMNKIEALTHETNFVGQTIQSKMKIEDWRTYGEVQYLKGRLDELNKLDRLIDLDMSGMRLVDARISKYLDKLQKVSPLAFELYHIEKENIKHTLERENKKTTKSSDSKNTK